MTRRVLGLLAGGATLLTFASCSTFETDTAATVNGTDITAEHLAKVGAQLSTVDGLREEFVDRFGGASGDLQRNLLGLLIDNEVAGSFLEARGRPLTQADLETAAQTLRDQGNADILDAGAEVANAIATNAAIATAIGELGAPTDDEIAAVYGEQPARLGVVCANQIVVSSQDAAESAAAGLAAGEPLADVAAAAGATGSTELIGTSGTPCPDLTDLASSMPPATYDTLLQAKPGVPLGPFEFTNSSAGHIWVVLQVQQLADAGENLRAALDASPGNLSYLGVSATADVWVSSEFGAWDPATRSVVALTPAADTAA